MDAPCPQSATSGRVDQLLDDLTLDEKAALTAGSAMFVMQGVARVGIPSWRVTDGPNGARGSSILGSGEARAVCIPCGSALGATWNPALIEQLGAVLGDETRTKQARVLLAPTVNLHRSPLGGRNFECYSEDPLLSGKAAAAFVRGAQSRGVITTVKHLIGNDAETERNTINSVIDERTLRELYLLPFEIAVKEGGSLGIMTSYNRLNGTYCTEHAELLETIVRQEWGFQGIVMTDWFAASDTVASAKAGLDVEMPGGGRSYGSALADAVRDGRLDDRYVHAIAERQLRSFDSINALDDEPGVEVSIDRPEHRALTRTAAADAMVLLRNNGDGAPVLPFDLDGLRTLAVIGPNASRAQIMGGGSANLRPHYRISPLDAFRAACGDAVTVVHEPGCAIDRSAPLLSGSAIGLDGVQGFAIEVFPDAAMSGTPAGITTRDTSRLMFMDEIVPGVSAQSFSARARTMFVPTVDGTHRFEMVQLSPTRVILDGALLVDGVTDPPPPGASFFGNGSHPLCATRDLVAGRSYEIVIEVFSGGLGAFAGTQLGCHAPEPDDSLQRAVAAARAADAVVLVVGTNDDWESEGEDRASMDLPGRQDELVDAVLAANPRTVVVVNTGSPVTMPWAERAGAILQCWFGGQEMANALVDVITGAAEPGGRLPTTFPQRLEHNPSYGNFPGANGEVRYGEGLLMGYRWYDTRHLPVRFAFGHGLSYTTFDVGIPTLDADSFEPGGELCVRVPVTNTGTRFGSHVVQCYVAPPTSRLDRPAKELKAFAKVFLEPGESTVVTLVLDDRSFAYWDPAEPGWPALRARLATTIPHMQGVERRTVPGWTIEPGTYEILIANSAEDIVHRLALEVDVALDVAEVDAEVVAR